MSSAAEFVKRAAGLHDAMGDDLAPLGGFLRCEGCGRRRDLGASDIGRYLKEGWPEHCGYTMRWWTQRQIEANEVPAVGLGSPEGTAP